MEKPPCEAIVVGSGATGGVAALTLAKAGIKVLVIESGPELSIKQAIGNEPTNSLKRLTGLINGNYTNQSQHPGYWKANPLLYANEKDNPYTYSKDKPFIWTQGCQVGGRSLTWGGITLRLSDTDFKAAREDGIGPEWPISYSDLSSHYSSLESSFQIHGNKDGLEQLPDGIYKKAFPFTSSEEYFSEEIKKNLDYPIIHSRGFGPNPNNNLNWPSYSSLGSTLKQAISTGNVEILSNHIVERLVLNNKRDSAKGLIIKSKLNPSRKQLDAELIVLCASTIQTIRILLDSHESEIHNGLIIPSGSLGSYLMDHISTCRFFRIENKFINANHSGYPTNQMLSGAGSFFMPFGNKIKEKQNNQFYRGYGIWGGIDRFEPPKILKRNPETKTGFLIGHGEVLPRKENCVTLSNKLNKWGVRVPHIDCCWRENEEKMVKHMNKTIEKSINAARGEMLPLNEMLNIPFFKKIADNALAIKDSAPPPGYYIHEVGGAAMGFDENSSVVNKWNNLWRCKNVLVVDGSCWPTSSWQSPTLTMMAITKRACEKAIKDLKK